MPDSVPVAERTRQAIAAAERGEIQDARTLLAEALRIDPQYQLAWLWFAAVTEDLGEEKFCLERARELDPEHRTSPALARLRDEKATSPEELVAIVDPPPPDFISGHADHARAKRRRRLIIRSSAILVIFALLAGLFVVISTARVKYTYLALVVGDEIDAPQGGQETIDAAQQAVDVWNTTQATSDHQIKLVTFNDQSDPDLAVDVANQIVDDGRFVGVIGHMLSSTSLAAAPVYAAAGIPAITPSATADALTKDNPWYYRTIFDNSQQGQQMAIYAHFVENYDSTIVISSDDDYGISLRGGFVDAFSTLGTVQADIVVSADPTQQTVDLQAAATQIASIDDPGVIALLVVDPKSAEIARMLKDLGVEPVFIGPEALDTQSFFQGVSAASKSAVDGSVVATPLTEGTLTAAAVPFYDTLSKHLGYKPSWVAGLTYDAVDAFTESMLRGQATWGTDDLVADRTRIRDALDSARSPSTALPTLSGGLYFEPDNSAQRPVAFDDGRVSPTGEITIHSAAYQLAPYSATAGVTLEDEIASGTAFTALGVSYTIQRVVSMGFNINQLSDLDTSSQTFRADFFLWFKYRGSPIGPSDVQFANAIDPGLSIGEPQRVSDVDGARYELYRVRGVFRTQMNFAAFPFDKQQLPIIVQNKTLSSAKLTYIPDPDNVQQTQSQRLQSGTDAAATYDDIPNWEADSLYFYPQSVGDTGALGDPSLTAAAAGVTYSQLVSDTTISRDVNSFLIKNLLPLLLLTLVLYVSLWYPFKDAGSRISFGVTGILTGAVMLNSVTSSLPDVDYTVAIEWAYYAFILLSGLCIFGALLGRRYTEDRQLAKARTLDRVLRIGYPTFVVGIAIAYATVF